MLEPLHSDGVLVWIACRVGIGVMVGWWLMMMPEEKPERRYHLRGRLVAASGSQSAVQGIHLAAYLEQITFPTFLWWSIHDISKGV